MQPILRSGPRYVTFRPIIGLVCWTTVCYESRDKPDAAADGAGTMAPWARVLSPCGTATSSAPRSRRKCLSISMGESTAMIPLLDDVVTLHHDLRLPALVLARCPNGQGSRRDAGAHRSAGVDP